MGITGTSSDMLLSSTGAIVAMDQHEFGGVWTRIKLNALTKYLSAFTTALSKRNFKRIYIDAFAGTGRCDITVDGERQSIDGSARRALDVVPTFHKYYFIELQAKKRQALAALAEEHHGKDVEIIGSDANAALQSLGRRYKWHDERAVLFLDPFGMHVDWSTLEAIAATEAVDVWYLFPYAGLYRQVAIDASALDVDKETSITRVLGTDSWRREFYETDRQASLFGHTASDVRVWDHKQMLGFVTKRLGDLFPAVSTPKVLYQGGDAKNPSGAPLFALYFAASNPSPRATSLAMRMANDILRTL